MGKHDTTVFLSKLGTVTLLYIGRTLHRWDPFFSFFFLITLTQTLLNIFSIFWTISIKLDLLLVIISIFFEGFDLFRPHLILPVSQTEQSQNWVFLSLSYHRVCIVLYFICYVQRRYCPRIFLLGLILFHPIPAFYTTSLKSHNIKFSYLFSRKYTQTYFIKHHKLSE